MKIDFQKQLNTLLYWKPNVKFLRSGKFWIASVIVCFALIFLTLFVFWYNLATPLSKGGEEKIFIVQEGEGLQEIAENLRLERIIGHKLVFVLYVYLKGDANNLQAGKYNLSPSMNIAEIAKKIIGGDVFHDWVKITIPEGWTSKQIEAKLIELQIVDPQKYTYYAISTESFPFLTDKPKDGNLQGYLFPDTYYFEKNSSIEEVIKKMLVNFREKLTDDLYEEIKRQNKTLHEILIMASILEKEVRSDEDRAVVSGIFWKRIKDKYPLESCATIAYILEVDKWQYSIEDTRIESPYNTYTNIGLPPTPINNPGLSAIKAAIYPQESDYYFFLTDPETGNTIFSKTFQEHSANKRKYF